MDDPPAPEYAPPTFPAAPDVEHTIGLDLGQARDFSALCVVERSVPKNEPIYAVRHLLRWPLGTPYTKIVNDVATLAYSPSLKLPRIAADRTGVGAAIMEMLAQALRDKANGATVVDLAPILITSGDAVSRGDDGCRHVAKKQLVSTVQALLSSDRLKIAPELPEAVTLRNELRAFKCKVTVAGNETFEAWRERDHDDMVLSLAMALWLAENVGRGVLQCWV